MSQLYPRQLVVMDDPTIQKHENCEFTPSLKGQQGVLHLASQVLGFFVFQHRMANPRVSVPHFMF